MQKNITIRKIILGAVVLYAGLAVYYIVKGFKSIEEEGSNVTQTISKEYLNLFRIEKQSMLTWTFTFFSNVRNPVTTANYLGEFTLVIYKIADVDSNYSLAPAKFIHGSTSMPVGVFFDIIKRRGASILYKSGKPNFTGEVFIATNKSDFRKIVESNTINEYSITSKMIGIRYSKEDINDFIIESEEVTSAILAFIVYNHKLYLIILSPNSDTDRVDTNILDALLNPVVRTL